jgi:hypothetical protein
MKFDNIVNLIVYQKKDNINIEVEHVNVEVKKNNLSIINDKNVDVEQLKKLMSRSLKDELRYLIYVEDIKEEEVYNIRDLCKGISEECWNYYIYNYDLRTYTKNDNINENDIFDKDSFYYRVDSIYDFFKYTGKIKNIVLFSDNKQLKEIRKNLNSGSLLRNFNDSDFKELHIVLTDNDSLDEFKKFKKINESNIVYENKKGRILISKYPDIIINYLEV